MANLARAPRSLRDPEAFGAVASIHVLRYDDFSAVSSTRVEEALVERLLRWQIPCTFGVIPFVCDPAELLSGGTVALRPFPAEKARLLEPLLKAGLAEVALHGYSHLALAPMREHQEFSDAVPHEVQRALIRRGRQHLEDRFGVKVRLFVPPWNRLSASTATVLQEEDLLLSATTERSGRAIGAELAQAPSAVEIRQTAPALRVARRYGGQGHIVGTLLHDYDFVESGYSVGDLSINEFDALLASWVQARCTRRSLITEAIASSPEPREKRVRANALLRRNLFGRRISRRLLPGVDLVYWDLRTARRLTAWARCFP